MVTPLLTHTAPLQRILMKSGLQRMCEKDFIVCLGVGVCVCKLIYSTKASNLLLVNLTLFVQD